MEEKRIFVRDLAPGQAIRDIFVISEARQGQAKNGPFWSLMLQDASGLVEAKMFSPASLAHAEITAGRLAVVEGQVGSFRDQVQVVVDRLHPLEHDDVDLSHFMPTSSEKPEVLLFRLEELHRQHLRYPAWRKLCKSVLGDADIRSRFLAAPGAKTIHHAYRGGLVEHSLSVALLCLKFCEQYPSLDREILLVAATFHDLGKAWELSLGFTREYTDEGRLLGHIVIGLEILEPFCRRAKLEPELMTHLKHIILSHHGEYDFGSPKRPKTCEALALHFADNLDSKIQTVDGLMADRAEGAWSPYQRSMERFLFKPRPTPTLDKAKASPAERVDQCSLLLKE